MVRKLFKLLLKKTNKINRTFIFTNIRYYDIVFYFYKIFSSKWLNINEKIDISVKIPNETEINCSFICNPSKGYTHLKLIEEKIHEKNITKIILKYGEIVDCMIDIGANFGYYSILFSKAYTYKDVFCFEPISETFNDLSRNIEINKSQNVKAYQIALGNIEMETSVPLSKESGLNSIVRVRRGKKNKIETIKITTLDKILKFRNCTLLFKIDVEGYEFEVFNGMLELLSNNSCFVVFEYSPMIYKRIANHYHDRLYATIDLFCKMNYYFFKINDDGKIMKINNDFFKLQSKHDQSNLIMSKHDVNYLNNLFA